MCPTRRQAAEVGPPVGARRSNVVTGLAVVVAALSGYDSARAQPMAPPPSSVPIATWRASAVLLTRLETWRYFEPRPGGGDPDYSFLGNRLRLELRRRWPRVETTLAAQAVSLAALPTTAIGPGALGTGALYFDQSGHQELAQQLFLRFANLRFPGALPGVDVQIGRMGYTSGAEAPSGVPKIEAVKRQRLDARLLGEFEWSIVQRAFDGVRLDLTRPGWKVTGVAVMPTQGGFAYAGNTTMTRVVVTGATVSSRPSGAAGGAKTQLQGVVWHYRDRRSVTQRPDNTGRTADAVDVDITTGGAVVVGAYPAGPGEADLFVWAAVQGGAWYDDDHRAGAAAVEGGYQWSAAPWRPWLRAGLFHASGDDDPADGEHGTFFPMLPTVRRFAPSTVYGTMNLREVFVEAQARPRPSIGLRADLRRLDLASAADLWYAGSGATRARGAVFGYAGRRSNGSRRLGTSVEVSADWAVTPWLSLNGFVARMRGGPVVTGTFGDDRLWFGYLESVIAIGAR